METEKRPIVSCEASVVLKANEFELVCQFLFCCDKRGGLIYIHLLFSGSRGFNV